MAAKWGNAGFAAGNATQPGLLARAAARLRNLLGLEQIRSAPDLHEPSLDAETTSQPFAPAGASRGTSTYRIASFCQDKGTEAVNESRLTVEQLDACIEDSIRRGTVDLQAGRLALHRKAVVQHASRTSPRRPAPASPPAMPQAASTRFGGDLYPTAAHRVGRHVREVRDSTWTRPAT